MHTFIYCYRPFLGLKNILFFHIIPGCQENRFCEVCVAGHVGLMLALVKIVRVVSGLVEQRLVTLVFYLPQTDLG